MRRRRRSTGRPGDEFLEALASGRSTADDAAVAGAVAAPPASDLAGRLFETERRAATAEEALSQLRNEAERRLADARAAIEREREGRLALERQLDEEGADDRPATSEAAPADEPSATIDDSSDSRGEQASEDDPDRRPARVAAPTKPLQRPIGPSSPASAPTAAWPTPWIDREETPRRDKRRRLFGRAADG